MIPSITFLLHLLAITINKPHNHKSPGQIVSRSLSGALMNIEVLFLCVRCWGYKTRKKKIKKGKSMPQPTELVNYRWGVCNGIPSVYFSSTWTACCSGCQRSQKKKKEEEREGAKNHSQASTGRLANLNYLGQFGLCCRLQWGHMSRNCTLKNICRLSFLRCVTS